MNNLIVFLLLPRILLVIYARDEAVPIDCFMALKWFQKAAERGLAYAQQAPGAMYFDGSRVTRNCKEAIRWFLKAAEQGELEVKYHFGVIRDIGCKRPYFLTDYYLSGGQFLFMKRTTSSPARLPDSPQVNFPAKLSSHTSTVNLLFPFRTVQTAPKLKSLISSSVRSVT